MVSNDAIAASQLSESMQRFALSPELCPDVPSALERLKRAKFEAIIIDFRLGILAGAVMEGARNSASNEHVVVVTLSDGEVDSAEAFKAGSTFVLQRPLSAASIDLALKTAYGFIVRERRRYFRCPVEVPVSIRRTEIQTINGRTVNVSEGGMSITAATLFEPGDILDVQFTLPANDFQFGLQSSVCWAKERQFGLRFTSLSRHLTSNLQEWLSRRLEEAIPQAVWERLSHLPQD